MRRALFAVAGLCLLIPAASAEATVLCSNPSGSIFIRDVCKSNETTVDLAALGVSTTKTVAGFVYGDGHTFGSGFNILKISNGHYRLRFPAAEFTNFPAIAVSAWGIPGFLPTADVAYNSFDGPSNSWQSEIYLTAPDGVTLVDIGFQFVAAQVK